MSQIQFVIKEFLRNLYRNPATALGSVLSLMLLFLLFDLFWVASLTSDRFYTDYLSDLRMEVFVSEEVPDTSITEFASSIEAVDGVVEVQYVSRADARDRLARMLGIDLLVGYDESNPLPRSFALTIAPEDLNSSDMARIEERILMLGQGLSVEYSREWLEKAESTRGVFTTIGLALGALIVLTTLISSASHIRLMARARAVGIRQMLLLGAGRFLVGMPFLLEGFVLAGLSALGGWGLVLWGQERVTFTQFELVMPSMNDIWLFCLVVAGLGGLSGYLGLRKLFKARL